MELLVCMSISGSIPVVICLLLYVIQRENYNYILGRRLLLTGVFFYLVPVQLVKYLLPKDALPETMLIGRKADSYLSGSLAFWSEKQGEYIWIPQWFNLFARIWLTGIIIFAIYEIVKYWRGAHSIRNYIFEKIENPEDNLIIVSKDKGFDSVVHFWSNRGYNICRKAPSIFHNSGIILNDAFYKSLYPIKANLQNVYKLYIEEFGQTKGAEYYRIYKPYAEFLQTTF